MDARLVLRRAEPADAVTIRSFTRAAYAHWVPVVGCEPRPMVVDYDEAVRRNSIDLLYADDVLAGLIELVLASDHLMIENVAVLARYRGRGLGRALMAHAEGVAVAAGYRIVRLYTNALMASNIQLYLRLGYRIDGEVAFAGGLRVNMSKGVRLS